MSISKYIFKSFICLHHGKLNSCEFSIIKATYFLASSVFPTLRDRNTTILVVDFLQKQQTLVSLNQHMFFYFYNIIFRLLEFNDIFRICFIIIRLTVFNISSNSTSNEYYLTRLGAFEYINSQYHVLKLLC